MEKRDRARKMVIVTEAEFYDGVGKDVGRTIFELALTVTAGEGKGDEIVKKYVFDGALPDYLRRDLLRLGYLINSIEDLQRIAGKLIGMVLRVSLVKDGDALRVYLDDYFGRDDPKKYKAVIR